MSTKDSGTPSRFLDNTIQSTWSVALHHPTANSEDLTYLLHPSMKEYTSTIFKHSAWFGVSRFFAKKFTEMVRDFDERACVGHALSMPLKSHSLSTRLDMTEWEDSYLAGPPYSLWMSPCCDDKATDGNPYPKTLFNPYSYYLSGFIQQRQQEIMAASLTYGFADYYTYVPVMFDKKVLATQMLLYGMASRPMECLLWHMLTRLTYYDMCDRVSHVIVSPRFRNTKFYTVHTPFREHHRNCQFWLGQRSQFTLIRPTDEHSLPILKFKSMFQQRATALHSEVNQRSETVGKEKKSCESSESKS